MDLEPIIRLSKDLKEASITLGVAEVRYMVDAYYTIQEGRKAAANQLRGLETSGEPHLVIAWVTQQMETLENQIKRALDAWTNQQPVGVWAKSIDGIGPVLSAGLLAHIDIRKAPTVGHIWSFAGLDPRAVWEKGQKRPWNADLKVLCWKIGESFVKVSGKPTSLYGRVYRERKDLEVQRNEEGRFKEQAEEKLRKFKIDKSTDAYKSYSIGKLPPAHIHTRAERYATKLFLAHLHHIMYHVEFGVDPPKPYVIGQLGHVHYIPPPNWP
jgi:hypothetical protein